MEENRWSKQAKDMSVNGQKKGKSALTYIKQITDITKDTLLEKNSGEE